MKLFLILASLGITGCGKVSKFEANMTGYSEICIDHITYLQFPSGVTPKYQIGPDLKSVLVPCGYNEK